ncbi:arylsulfatase A-like enzyme [Povalibacter uvarum]|uniref:Arylsulfatase A-like enzyme n=1 Tax=Povalibacter uvarum TaxID=732238 RepID=A0A841HP50_9GAMM|nr:sulfatase-like hydrolase/transferase [Povalibacter uvarum]MBB6094917.1 arylsulfatase A-like enzyme [Povalibacter uvarum]
MSWRKAFWLAVGLSLLLLLVSFARIITGYGYVFTGGDKVLSSVVDVPLLGTRLGWDIAWFITATLLVHLAFAGLTCLLAKLTELSGGSRVGSRATLVLGWFLLLSIGAFVANAYYYPWSTLGEYFGDIVSTRVLGAPVAAYALVAIGILMVAATAPATVRGLRSARLPSMVTSIAVVGALGVAITISALLSGSKDARAIPNPTKPNVILIGVDSLRPDFTVVGGDHAHAPNINKFIRGARVFSDVTTPLARTFPSWMSILTGRHPHDTGALMNLTRRGSIEASPTLAEVFRGQGYRSIFAIDETRFANIDQSYGFDQVITPPMGAADFLLGTLNDTLLSNLVSRTPFGSFFFPHASANRAAAHVYYPGDFVDRLENELEFPQPTFLAVHLTLPHYPYYWATAPLHKEDGSNHHGQTLYPETVRHADGQVGALFELLESRGALENAIVVILSDHGEGLGRPEDVLITTEQRKVDDYSIPARSNGHGTSVLSPPQYQVLLAIRGYGAAQIAKLPPAASDVPASLEDLMPTLLGITGVNVPGYKSTGRSLVPELMGDPPAPGSMERIRFTESEFNPPALLAGFQAEKELARQAAKFYRVDPESGLLSLREELLAEAMANREYAAIGSKHVLAAIPEVLENHATSYRYVLVNRDRTQVRLLADRSASVQAGEDVVQLWDALDRRFRLEASLAAPPALATVAPH